jgi:hypothetical protein
MTDSHDPHLELAEDDDEALAAPPTSAQRAWIREAVRAELGAQMKPILDAWDQRSRDMLDVLREAADAKAQVRSASRAIKIAGWLGVASLLVSGLLIWQVLEGERTDRRAFRETEALRRLEAAQLIIDASHEDVRRIDTLVREACPVKPAARN